MLPLYSRELGEEFMETPESAELAVEKRPGCFLRIGSIGIKQLRGKRVINCVEFSGGPTLIAVHNRPLSGIIPDVIGALGEVAGWDNADEKRADLYRLREIVCEWIEKEMSNE